VGKTGELIVQKAVYGLAGLALALACAGAAGAGAPGPRGVGGASPAFDPRDWHGAQVGASTRMLTLGSFHLGQAPVDVNEAMMGALLDKLAAYRPDIITVEQVSGEQCDHLQRYVGVYPDSFDTWCRDAAIAQKAVGTDGPAAAAAVRKTLAAWPAQPTAAQRRRLASLFLAAGEWPSAVVQWRRLPVEDQHVGDGVTADTVSFLERKGAKPNETYDIAVALAVRLGLERIHQVDDHTSDGALADEDDAAGDVVGAAWKVAPAKAVAQEAAMEAKLKTPGDVLQLYRLMNRPERQREVIKADFRANLTYPSPKLYGRHYVSAWQVRNLRMVSNILSVAALHPGARVLNVVGATHKAYYDAYLNMIPDVELVDAEQVLK
jgi:hypothetical protein